jgi:hypothetical protein
MQLQFEVVYSLSDESFEAAKEKLFANDIQETLLCEAHPILSLKKESLAAQIVPRYKIATHDGEATAISTTEMMQKYLAENNVTTGYYAFHVQPVGGWPKKERKPPAKKEDLAGMKDYQPDVDPAVQAEQKKLTKKEKREAKKAEKKAKKVVPTKTEELQKLAAEIGPGWNAEITKASGVDIEKLESTA